MTIMMHISNNNSSFLCNLFLAAGAFVLKSVVFCDTASRLQILTKNPVEFPMRLKNFPAEIFSRKIVGGK